MSSSVKDRMVQYAKNQGDNKSVMCRKLNASVTSFRGKNIQQGVSSDTLVRYISLYSDVDVYWLLDILDLKNALQDGIHLEEETDNYKTKNPKEQEDSFLVDVLNRNNIALVETNKYLIEQLQKNEKDS